MSPSLEENRGAPPGSEQGPNAVARRALSGFFLSGVLFAFLGAILPAWRHHLTEDYILVGAYFLSVNAGFLAAYGIAGPLRKRRGIACLMALGCGIASAGLFSLALLPAELSPWWRMAGMAAIGCGGGLLNIGVFHAVSPLYRHDPAATVTLAGAFFGIGCVLVTILVAGTFYAYTVPSTLVFIGVIPAYFGIAYAKMRFPAAPAESVPLRAALADFRSPAAVLFTLLLFFQFGNEWAIAGWLPLFLIQRLGLSSESSVLMLAVYWLALLVGRIVVMWILPRMSHARLLMASVVGAMLGCLILVLTNNRFGAVAGILFTGVSFAATYPLMVERIGGRFPYYHPGFFNGIFSFALTGGMLAPWSLGFFVASWGIQAVMIVPALGTMMVFVLLILLWAEARLTDSMAAKSAAGR